MCHPFAYSEELIRTLHEMGYKIYILSNYGETLLGLNREKYTFLNYVDGGVFSYAVKQMKPDDVIYQTLIEKCGIEPENAVFLMIWRRTVRAPAGQASRPYRSQTDWRRFFRD